MSPQAKRDTIANLRAEGTSERRACRLLALSRSAHRRPCQRKEDADLVNRICHIAAERRRFGYRRIHWMLLREGVPVNHKKVYRI